MEYKVIPITQLEHATWDQVKDGHYVVPIGFPDQTSKESKYIDIWQLQDTINVTQIIDQATDQRAGLMSAEDKGKLDILSIEATLNNNIINGEAVGSLRTLGSMEEKDGYSLGAYAFSEGERTQASGRASHAEGLGVKASNDYAHAEGWSTIASGWASHAEGAGDQDDDLIASGRSSHAEGEVTIASGVASHAEGYLTKASANYSHAQNYGTIAASEVQTAIGKFNIEDNENQYSLIIGNGTTSSNRSNAFAVDWEGNATLAGNIYVNNSISENNKLVTKAELNSIETIEVTDIGYTITTAGETIQKNISNTSFLDLIYPVGSIYMSMNTTNPSTLFGGVWQSLAQGKMLLGADGENYITGDPNKGSGGNKDAVLVEHTHNLTRTTSVGVTVAAHKVNQPAFSTPNHSHHMADGRDWVTITHSANSIGEHKVASGSSYTVPTIKASTNVYAATNTPSNGGGIACTRKTDASLTNNHAVTVTQPVFTNDTQGVSGINANLPPYLVVNMWQRIE